MYNEGSDIWSIAALPKLVLFKYVNVSFISIQNSLLMVGRIDGNLLLAFIAWNRRKIRDFMLDFPNSVASRYVVLY